MYVFIRSCIALTRGVVKIIQTDPDSFFSSRSGTLSSTAAPTYHPTLSLLFVLLSLFRPFLAFLYPALSRRSSFVGVSSFPRISPVTLSSHCPGAEFEIAPVFDLAPDDLFAFCILLVAHIGAIRGAHASYTGDYRAQITRSERQKRSKLRRTTICNHYTVTQE